MLWSPVVKDRRVGAPGFSVHQGWYARIKHATRKKTWQERCHHQKHHHNLIIIMMEGATIHGLKRVIRRQIEGLMAGTWIKATALRDRECIL